MGDDEKMVMKTKWRIRESTRKQTQCSLGNELSGVPSSAAVLGRIAIEPKTSEPAEPSERRTREEARDQRPSFGGIFGLRGLTFRLRDAVLGRRNRIQQFLHGPPLKR